MNTHKIIKILQDPITTKVIGSNCLGSIIPTTHNYIKLKRVCVPLGLDCNLNCRYCYRNLGKDTVGKFTPLMIDFLNHLDCRTTESVIASGGEPLLYFAHLKELFSYIPENIHGKIMTNGSFLNENIVSWANREDIEIQISWEGDGVTEQLRGYNPLEDPTILKLIQNIKILRVNAVITRHNTNLLKLYDQLVHKLNREDFRFTCSPVIETEDKSLITGFNIDEYIRTFYQLYHKIPRDWAFNHPTSQRNNLPDLCNVLPNGNIVGWNNMHYYGTVLNSLEEIKNSKEYKQDLSRCLSCQFKDVCPNPNTNTTDFNCSINKRRIQILKMGSYGNL